MGILDDFFSIVKGLMDKEDIQPEKKVGKFSISKGSDGRYRWLAVYSNSFRDDDSVPEIISSVSHKEFVAGVDAGTYDYPDLLFWHVPEWKFGKATVVAYDEVEPGIGFAIAGGTIDVGKEYVAEALLESGTQWQMSHGMPTGSIVRYAEDGTIYRKHVSTELTVLPGKYAANHLTGFGVSEDIMIPKHKRTELMDNLGWTEDQLNKLEESNKAVATEQKADREFKEATDTDSEEQVDVAPKEEGEVNSMDAVDAAIAASVDSSTAATDDAEASTDTIQELPEPEAVQEESVSDVPAEIDIQTLFSDFSKQMAEELNGIKEVIVGTVDGLESLKAQNVELEKQLKGVKEAQDNEVAVQTPSFSELYSPRIKSIIGSSEAVVTEDDNDKLDGPQEKSAGEPAPFGTFLGGLVANSKMTQ